MAKAKTKPTMAIWAIWVSVDATSALILERSLIPDSFGFPTRFQFGPRRSGGLRGSGRRQ